MTFIELRCFSEVARSGGVSTAGERMGLSKSAVSKHLTRLEAHLGVKLLERSSRRVRLTAAGEKLLPRVESIVTDGQLLVEQAREQKADPSGLVRVAATPEFGAVVAQRFFPEVVARYPALRLAMTSAYVLEDLQDPHFDFALRIGQVSDERLVAKNLGSFGRVLIASPAFLDRHPLEEPGDLSRVPCLIFSGHRSSATWTLFHHDDPGCTDAIDVPVRAALSVLSFTTLLALAEQGMGVANVPCFVARRAIASGRVVRCLAEYVSRQTPVFLVYRFGTDRVRRVAVVLEMARQWLPNLLAQEGGYFEARATRPGPSRGVPGDAQRE